MATYAVVSDIHGNILALRAVVADMARRVASKVINLGDNASGPLWPLETTRALMELDWIHARGNHDRLISEGDLERLKPSDTYAYRHLGEAERAWLGNLQPVSRAGDGIAAFHGLPEDDEGYLVETVEAGRTRLSSPREVRDRLGALRAGIALCGHTHLQRCVRLGDGALVINPGSVGLPAYAEREENPHVVESGSPHARYAIVSSDGGSWMVDFILVEYDWDEAADKARAEGRLDWERALRSGFMS